MRGLARRCVSLFIMLLITIYIRMWSTSLTGSQQQHNAEKHHSMCSLGRRQTGSFGVFCSRDIGMGLERPGLSEHLDFYRIILSSLLFSFSAHFYLSLDKSVLSDQGASVAKRANRGLHQQGYPQQR